MKTYCEEKEAVLAELNSAEEGLGSAEAQARLSRTVRISSPSPRSSRFSVVS